MNDIFVYKSNGIYLGFIRNGFLFSRDGICLGWIENDFIWDTQGQFKGLLYEINGHKYVVVNRFTLKPAQRSSKIIANQTVLSNQSNIPAISLPVELTDAF